MVQKSLITFTILLGLYTTTTTKPFFDNDIIRLLDGMRIGSANAGICGKDMHDYLWLINEIRIMQDGMQNRKTSAVVKRYRHRGIPCTLRELAEHESRLQEDLRDPWKDHDSVLAEINELRHPLAEVKEDFIRKAGGFVQQIRLTKRFIVELIEEWASRRHRDDTLLLEWAKVADKEIEAFREMATSNTILNEFLGDLRQFLTDMASSCPKAFQEFLEHKAEYTKAANKS
ncbi:hypothetical protein JW872_00635 [Candidatus Babeliales bacterium]|nr:hypothetical protein [Candidatus Babeliales bacterium]